MRWSGRRADNVPQIKKTMKSIKFVLTERFYTWENAREAAMQDEEIDMYADIDNGGVAYLPKNDGFEVCI